MRYSPLLSLLPLLLLLLHRVVAVDLAQTQQLMMLMHPCAQGCILSATTASCGSVTDLTCSCGPKIKEITAGALPCMLEQCRKDDIGDAVDIIGEICQMVALAGNPSTANTTANTNTTSTDTTTSSPPPSGLAANAAQRLLGGLGMCALATLGVVALV